MSDLDLSRQLSNGKLYHNNFAKISCLTPNGFSNEIQLSAELGPLHRGYTAKRIKKRALLTMERGIPCSVSVIHLLSFFPISSTCRHSLVSGQ